MVGLGSVRGSDIQMVGNTGSCRYSCGQGLHSLNRRQANSMPLANRGNAQCYVDTEERLGA